MSADKKKFPVSSEKATKTGERMGTVALVVRFQKDGTPLLIEALSDDQEISVYESGMVEGDCNPLAMVYGFRERQRIEDEAFGDYVESLLSKPFLNREIQTQAMNWLKSKVKVEDYHKSEVEATRVIAGFAYRLLQENPDRREFVLSSTHAQVKIRIFELPETREEAGQAA